MYYGRQSRLNTGILIPVENFPLMVVYLLKGADDTAASGNKNFPLMVVYLPCLF